MERKKNTKNQLLLLEDVTNLGRKGDLVYAKPGFVRNFLLPQKKGVIADKRTIRMQEQLKEERAKQAIEDKKEAKQLSTQLKEKILTMTVKTDIQGHLYGSVSSASIVELLAEEGVTIERKNVILPHAIKNVGVYEIRLKLKEDVLASFKLKVDSNIPLKLEEKGIEVVEEGKEEKEEESLPTEEEQEDFPMRSERKKEYQAELEERKKG